MADAPPPEVKPPPPPPEIGKRAIAGAEAGTRRCCGHALALVGVGVLALLVRGIYLAEISHTPLVTLLMGDALSYDTWAQQIAGGQWLGKEVFYQAPLYPYFLGVVYALFGHSLWAVRVIQIALGAGACVLLARAGESFISRRAGLLAGVLLALYPTAIFFDGLIQKSVLDTFFICLLLCLMGLQLERTSSGASSPHSGGVGEGGVYSRRVGGNPRSPNDQPFSPSHLLTWFWIGVVLGGLMLTRENAAVLALLVVVWAGVGRAWSSAPSAGRSKLWRAGVASVALVLAGMALVLMPVVIRNEIVGGEFHLTTAQFGPNFYIGNNPKADGTYRPLRAGRGSFAFERLDATELAQRALKRTLTPREVSGYWAGQAWAFMRDQPGAWLHLMGRKVRLLWNAVELVDTEDQYTYAQYSWVLWLLGKALNFGTIVPLAMLGTAATAGRWRRLWVIYAMVGAYAGSVVAFYVFARYRFPIVPFLLLLGAGVAQWRASGAATARGWRVGAWAAVGVATAGVAVWVNIPAASVTAMRAVTENNLGVYITLQMQRPDEAMEHFQKALELKPDFVGAHNNVAAALAQRGDFGGAFAQYRAALAADPGIAATHYDFAQLLERTHDVAGAIEQYAQAEKLNPDDLMVHSALGLALARGGRLTDAAKEFAWGLRLEPNDLSARFNLANALRLSGDYAQAAQQFEEVLRRQPGDAAARTRLAEVYKAQGREAEAAALLRQGGAVGGGSGTATTR